MADDPIRPERIAEARMEMMDVAKKLLSCVGTVVTLEFHDGEIVDARIRAVDVVEHDDVIDEVVRAPSWEGDERKRAQLTRAGITEIASVSDSTSAPDDAPRVASPGRGERT